VRLARAILGLALGSLAGCALPGPQPLDTTPALAPGSVREGGSVRAGGSAAPQEEARLYARDGTVVTPRTAGSVSVTSTPQREVQGSEGSRYHMLELYQQVVDERDELNLEVLRLAAEVERSRARQAEIQASLTALERDAAAREAELERLREDNLELAGSLTTAQIRRLQAEKMLLESRLEWQRVRGPGGMNGAEDLPVEAAAPGLRGAHEPGSESPR
jgi:hypothetical protein